MQSLGRRYTGYVNAVQEQALAVAERRALARGDLSVKIEKRRPIRVVAIKRLAGIAPGR